jgi:hypothetical protein
MNTRSYIFSMLIAGAIIGLLANLPALNIINCFLCIWVWLGGALAVIFYRQFQKSDPYLTPGQGAGLGALSGLIGAFVGIFVNALTSFISYPMFNSIMQYLQIQGDNPFRQGIPALITSTFFFFILDVIGYPIFGALSGFITASLFKKEMEKKPES